MDRSWTSSRGGLCALLLTAAVVSAPVRAQPADETPAPETEQIPLGEAVERLTAASDSTQHYALYVPSDYDPGRPVPVAFLMDPRGRAMTPLRLFEAAAEERGYLLISSHETLSDADTSFAVNERALNAMLRDVQLRFAVDLERLYLVGFSGTAHYAWSVAPSLDGFLAGIVGVGDGLPHYQASVQATLAMDRPPAYVGIAGTHDFNYDNALVRDRELDETALRHRFRSFPGGHSWPPEALAAEALAWFDLLADHDRLPEADLQAYLASRLQRASDTEAAGDPRLAHRLYREVVADFDGLVDVREAADGVRRLGRQRAVRRALRDEEHLAREVFEYKLTVRDVLGDLMADPARVTPQEAARRLDLDRHLRDAEDTERPLRAAASGRMLSAAFVNLSFYGPRQAIAAAQFETADRLLSLARTIRPRAPSACTQHARALAQLGRLGEAFDAVACAAVFAPFLDTLREDPLLAPLRGHPRYAEHLGG